MEPFTRDDEKRLRDLNSKVESRTATDEELLEAASLGQRYDTFIQQGIKALQDGSSSKPEEKQNAIVKGMYFWGSLIGTAVPGIIGKKTGVAENFRHWNWITERLILGAMPVMTKAGNSGGHLDQILEQCNERKTKLGLVVGCLEAEELKGFGVSIVDFAQPKNWEDKFGAAYFHVPMPDATADVNIDLVRSAVRKVNDVIMSGDAVYVHCKAGKGRSWMVVMCYLTSIIGLPFSQAEKLVKERRQQVNPGPAQVNFVRNFLRVYPPANSGPAGTTKEPVACRPVTPYDEVLDAAMRLPTAERERLIEALLQSGGRSVAVVDPPTPTPTPAVATQQASYVGASAPPADTPASAPVLAPAPAPAPAPVPAPAPAAALAAPTAPNAAAGKEEEEEEVDERQEEINERMQSGW